MCRPNIVTDVVVCVECIQKRTCKNEKQRALDFKIIK